MNIPEVSFKEMNEAEAFNMSGSDSKNAGWVYVFLFIGIYSLLAQWDLPIGIRPLFLTIGFLFCVLAAISLLFIQLRKEYLLLALIIGVILYWLFAFPAAIIAPVVKESNYAA